MCPLCAQETSRALRRGSRLNENYKKLISKLPTERKNALVEAQRAWIKFRDANCGFYADPDGGVLSILKYRSKGVAAQAEIKGSRGCGATPQSLGQPRGRQFSGFGDYPELKD